MKMGRSRQLGAGLTLAALLATENTWTAEQTFSVINTEAISITQSLTGANAQSALGLALTWNTSGTPTAIKLVVTDTASNVSSLFLDLRTAAASMFSVGKGGQGTFAGNLATSGHLSLATASSLTWAFTRSRITSPSDGVLALQNNAQTDFSRLQFGGTTSSFPSLKRTGAALEARLADDSTYANFSAGSMLSNGSVAAAGFTAITAGGSLLGLKISSTANFGVFVGSGVPTISAAKGSLYLRSDGSGVNDRAYIATDGAGTWTPIVTVG